MKNVLIIFAVAAMIFAGCANNENRQAVEKATPAETSAPVTKKKTIIFFGNSLTAGYGLSPSEAFPAIIQRKIDSLGLPYNVINAGVSGETSSGGTSRIDWILREPVDIFVLELGANDGLRGIPPVETKKNLQAIISKVKAKNPSAKLILAGMQIPPNMGQTYATEFRNVFPELAKENGISLIPFVLEGVGGEARFNQQDGIHPTAEGHFIVAENIWRELKALL
ncbi:MAG: GDSL-type esterase/lipase family protein [Chitinophagaceae bacterium]